MLELVRKFWRFISHIGIKNDSVIPADELKSRIFFNRCMFIGVFSLFGTTFSTWPFIGAYSLLNLLNIAAIIIALIVHARGCFGIAKRIVIYTLFSVGLVLTSISGGDFLYHTGIITVLTFGWVMFTFKNESAELLLFFVLATIGYLIGELNPFEAPDFSDHPNTASTRIFNLIGYTGVSLIFISFMRRLNTQYVQTLKQAVLEKEELIQEVKLKTKALEDESLILEEQISNRTSELIQQKKALESQNTEKEVLLKEIHHRVKNNLQIIVSLLNLQANKFEDQHVLDAINETQNRIISMSLVHQRMYQTADFVAVEFKDYTDLLFDNISTIYGENGKNIQFINKIIPDLSLDIETAIPLGLVINEMITNSFKHAFNGVNQSSNEILIEITSTSASDYLLICKDNGVGFREGFLPQNSESLGFQLITALVEQINGEVKYHTENGAVFEIRFSGHKK